MNADYPYKDSKDKLLDQYDPDVGKIWSRKKMDAVQVRNRRRIEQQTNNNKKAQ